MESWNISRQGGKAHLAELVAGKGTTQRNVISASCTFTAHLSKGKTETIASKQGYQASKTVSAWLPRVLPAQIAAGRHRAQSSAHNQKTRLEKHVLRTASGDQHGSGPTRMMRVRKRVTSRLILACTAPDSKLHAFLVYVKYYYPKS